MVSGGKRSRDPHRDVQRTDKYGAEPMTERYKEQKARTFFELGKLRLVFLLHTQRGSWNCEATGETTSWTHESVLACIHHGK